MTKFWLLVGLLCWALLSPAFADNLFVGNRPYKGKVYGVGDDLKFSLQDLGKALGVTVMETSEGWFLGGQLVQVSLEQGVTWIDLKSLPTSVVKVVRNKQMGTLDIYRAEGNADGSLTGSWGRAGTLVLFGAQRDSLTQQMLSTVKELDSSKLVHVVFVDVEDERKSAYTEYDYLFQGNRVPYVVLLGSDGAKRHSFVGVYSKDELRYLIQRYLR